MKKRKQRRTFLRTVQEEIMAKKGTFTVYLVLRAFVIVILIRRLLYHQYEDVLLCLLTLFLLILPQIVQTAFRIDLPSRLEIILFCFAFAAEIMGEVQHFYLHIPFWDSILHTVNGFLCAVCGFSLVEILNNKPSLKFELSPVFMSLVAFCFSMTIGVLWEFFEFGMDQVFLLDMQKDTVIGTIASSFLRPEQDGGIVVIRGIEDTLVNGESLGVPGYLDIGLIDTMHDLLVNFIGAAVFSIFGYFYTSRKGSSFVENWLIRKRPAKA